MRMVLTAPAVAKLVELDPDGTVELAKSAATQVAQEIANRMTQEAVEKRVDSFIRSDMLHGDGWFNKSIAQKYGRLLAHTMNAMAMQFINNLTSGALNAAIHQRVHDVLNDGNSETRKLLDQRAEEVLREKFASLFGGSK